MTKGELEQLRSLHREIEELEYSIAGLQSKRECIVVDKVTASTRDFPYTQTSVKIEGIDYVGNAKAERQIKTKESLLKARRQQAKEMEIRIIEFINNVPDSRIRRIMQYKYVDGYTWEQIGHELHCDRTTAEKMVSKYLNES